jgi:hypothetical protein
VAKIKNIRFGALTNDFMEAEGKHYITIWMLSDYDKGEVKLWSPINLLVLNVEIVIVYQRTCFYRGKIC